MWDIQELRDEHQVPRGKQHRWCYPRSILSHTLRNTDREKRIKEQLRLPSNLDVQGRLLANTKWTVVIVMILIALCLVSVFLILDLKSYESKDKPQDAGFLQRTLTLHGSAYKYEVFVPDGWSPGQKLPIILFLHGAGERGSDGWIQTQVGIGEAIRKNRSRFRAIVVMPQCPADHWWTTADMEELALAELAAATKEFKGDHKHTYLTGLSMGGFAAWDIAEKNPHKFAAVVPISSGVVPPKEVRQMYPELGKFDLADESKSYAATVRKIGKTPVWIFHGADDHVVLPGDSRKVFAALKKAGGDVRYTEYPGIGHNSWEKAYAEPDLMSWLFSKSL